MSDTGSENGDKEEGPSIGIYEGDRNALKERHGKGKNTFPNGDTYEGQYANSKRSGQGVYKWKAGHRYIGNYQDNQRNGQGYFVYPDGSKYRGDFVAGKRHGSGVYAYANGDVYQGAWENDLKHGQGVYMYQNGSKARKSGNWVEGKLLGPGEIIYADHKIIGNFKSDDRMDMPVKIHFTKTNYTKTVHDPALVGMEAPAVL
ncbi:hypothetical protein HK105_200105 [Polyrhizophydium stewartii]|uniref:Uncharacterized protein n=1 Tax=Polyrhizophydium stewartii TaxID=2732419 RepID=A0ABR4NKP9_9FUNG|nr:Radial spoke head 1 [Polyrhizophydium stewartii]